MFYPNSALEVLFESNDADTGSGAEGLLGRPLAVGVGSIQGRLSRGTHSLPQRDSGHTCLQTTTDFSVVMPQPFFKAHLQEKSAIRWVG